MTALKEIPRREMTVPALLGWADQTAEVLSRRADGGWPEEPARVGRDGRLVIERIDFAAPLIDAYVTTDLAG